MIADRNIVYDGQTSVSAGISSGVAPNRVLPTQVSFAVNTTFRGDYPRSRPGWKQISLTYADATTQSRFEDGLFQCAAFYEHIDDRDAIVLLSGGRLFRIQISDMSVLEVTPSAGADINDPSVQEGWMQQAEQFLIVQNDRDAAIVWDGSSSTRNYTVPSGSIMTYANGRLWITLRNRRSFVASDLVFGPSGTAPYERADAVLHFTENDYLNEGGTFGVPAPNGSITAMRPVANLDTSLGQGPMQVFCSHGSFSVNAPFDRTTWKDLTWPIQTVSTLTSGPLSSSSPVHLNGDLWYRASDGLRSFQVARRNHNSWVNTVQSHELDRILAADDQALLKFNSSVTFDNRLLSTCLPRLSSRGIYHLGLVALNLDNVSGITEQSQPSYDGVWTGLRIYRLVAGRTGNKDRCFALCQNPTTTKMELWELSRDNAYDKPIVSGNAEDRRISWIIETRSFTCGKPLDLKALEGVDLWIDHLHGNLDMTVKYRPDQYPAWSTLGSKTACAQMTSCNTADCTDPYDLKEQHRSRLMFGRPSDGCEPTNSMQMPNGFEHQLRLELTGAAALIKLRVKARMLPELPNGCST